MAKLHEPRVQRILEPMLLGERTGQDVLSDDFAYVMGLGLLALRDGGYDRYALALRGNFHVDFAVVRIDPIYLNQQ